MQKEIFDIKNDAEFEMLALSIFDYQMESNSIYAPYAALILKGKAPNNIFEIPFLPISFFKTEQIICQGRAVEEVFLSSGTSGDQSKHLVSDISLYRESYLKAFELFYGDITQYCILSLLPNYREREGSSLIYMVDDLISKSKHEQSGFYLNDYESLSMRLQKLEKEGQKTILFGVSYALLDLAEQFPQKLEHTIIIETGGTKGKRKEMLKEELHQNLKAAFSLEVIHSEYGMSELLSQSYSNGEGIFKSPPWKKVLIRDTNDPLTIIGDNKTGGINVIDLANIYSCPFIATQDLGKTFEDGTFTVLGRFDNSDLRGCNLLLQ
ncbi:MAG: acyl transferase [Cryomorphaceae bacterium BACL11 MAG-121015-bin20]|nr:MAG: acyl transferase [Cryomorphaceae bacterium BACL11 MAG-121015-bin20]